jgi:hypothetical protein
MLAGRQTNKDENIKSESLIDKSIKKIEANVSPELEVSKSFHLLGANIFNHLHPQPTQDIKINNFNLDEITKKYPEKIEPTDRKLMVTFNLHRTSFYDQNGSFLGSFTVSHIIKYLGNIYDSKKQFLKDIEDYTQGKICIKKFMFKLKYNKVDGYTDILIYDYTKSGFMGDIEVLINISQLLLKYLKYNLSNDLSHVDHKNRVKIEQNIKKFVFLFLNYILKLLSLCSDKIKDRNNELKEKIIMFSVEIVSQINLFVFGELKIMDQKNSHLKKCLEINTKIKKILNKKIDQLKK